MGGNIKTTREIRDSIPCYTFQELSEVPNLETELQSILKKKWVSVDDLLLDMDSWLDSNDYDEIMQCVSDFISELKEG